MGQYNELKVLALSFIIFPRDILGFCFENNKKPKCSKYLGEYREQYRRKTNPISVHENEDRLDHVVIPFTSLDVSCTRRASLTTAVTSITVLCHPQKALQVAAANELIDAKNMEDVNSKSPVYNTTPSLTIPLHYESKLSAYIIYYRVGNSKFGAIVDTGSPFLVVPQTSCRPDYPWGCYRPEESREATGLKPTMERFDGNEGWVQWREGAFSFLEESADTSNSVGHNTITRTPITSTSLDLLFPSSSSMTFGVISEALMDGPGGIFFGLVKNTDSWIRPSLLGQSQVTGFSLDLRKSEGTTQSLTLYGKEIEYKKVSQTQQTRSEAFSRSNYFDSLKMQDYIPLTNELNRKYGDPTIHYVAVASSINVNGSILGLTSRRDGKLYVIFDTGCSGMSICPDLFDMQYSLARFQKAKNVWDRVEVEFKTRSGERITLAAKRPITTPLTSDKPWGKKLDGHLIVLGLAFLENLKMTIDADHSKVWIEE